MVEEALNFGMNATQISQVSGLKSRVSDLDFSIQNVLDELNEIRDEQVSTTRKQEEMALRQEKEYQIQKAILSLKNSIFNLKTEMEDIYQSNELSTEDKYLEFRNIYNSPILEKLNPDYFDKFEDKEYTLSVKKYLFKTRDELFNSLDNNKKSLIKVLESKETELNALFNQNIQKPSEPQEPKFNKNKLIIKKMPVTPKNYYHVSKLRRSKDLEYKDGAPPYAIFGVLATILISGVPMIILGYIFGDENWVIKDYLLELFAFSPPFIGLIVYTIYIFKLTLNYKERKTFYDYETELASYSHAETNNKNMQNDYESKLQEFKNDFEKIMKKHQLELKIFDDYQNRIEKLKENISHLYQSFLK